MRFPKFLSCLLLMCVTAGAGTRAWCDESPSLPDNPAPSITSADQRHGYTGRETTWRNLTQNFGHDQKDIWLLYPARLATGHHWIPTIAVVGGTAALIYADPPVAKFFTRHLSDSDKINDVFDPMIATGEIIAVPASLMAVGYARHDNYEVDTALMSAQAYGDSAIVDLAIKAVTRRQRPSDAAAQGTFTNTFFNGGKSPLKGSSFPSGHAAGAFSVATVVAERYKNHRWVPWAVYGMATAISASRLSTNAHFSSDVWLGGALGYTIAKYQVLRPQ